MGRNQVPVHVPGSVAIPQKSAGGSEKIASLDGMRSISILIVFFAHAGPESGRLMLTSQIGVTLPGTLGVTVFFFLSGFLITTLLRREYDAAQTINFKGFYLRRLLRIFPPLYAMLAIVWLLCQTGVIHYAFDGLKLLAAAAQMGNYWMIAHGIDALPPGAGVLWSLAVEEHFYLVFPLLYLGLRRHLQSPLHQAVVLWVLCGLFFAWRWVLIAHGAGFDRILLSTDTRFDAILYGCALATWGNPALDPTRLPRWVWIFVLMPLGLAALGASHVVRGPARDALKYTLQGIGLIPIFCAVVRFPDFLPFRLLNWRPVVFLGVLSYSFYLIHALVLALLAPYAERGSLKLIVVGFIASFGIAWLMHVFIEKPSNRLRHRLPMAKPAARAPAAESLATSRG